MNEPLGGMPLLLVAAVALIDADNRVLIAQRPAGKMMAGLWEFPGGKIDIGETHAAALVREIREELDADVDVGDLIFEVAHAYDDRTVALYFYRCTLHGIPRPLLGQEMRWVPRADLATLGFPPADAEQIKLMTGAPVR
ncbi:MAG: (deoxy)nucleoside triphosphate pyrophosphohydrolase [Microvirga sp.]